MLPRMMLLTLLLYAPPALAFDTTKLGQGGSITLDEDQIQALIDQSSKLRREVNDAVASAGKKPEQIICTGMRFPRTWKELGGARVSPYQCQIGAKWLAIRATVRVFDQRGKLYQSINGKAMERANTVKETMPMWTWSDKEPK